MSLEKYFCSSPWFHMRINNQGNYEYCRWATRTAGEPSESFITFFKQGMKDIRQQMIDGQPVQGCAACYEMEAHGKISGRQKQLLKTGITVDNFAKTLLSSPWADAFTQSETNLSPQDWQIDLGNYCNSACVFCRPDFSSRLATEFKRVGIAASIEPGVNWTDDPARVDSFIRDLLATPKIRYLHFIGGEPTVIPAFGRILQALVDQDQADKIIIGFTTNLMTWPDKLVDLLCNFKLVNIGLSVETLTLVNDYARWPAKLDVVQENLDRWVKFVKEKNWLAQLRTTPTFLTVADLLSVYDYAWAHNIIVESCNFIENPRFLTPLALPEQVRKSIADKFKQWIQDHELPSTTVTNIRSPESSRALLVQDLTSYVEYLTTAPSEEHRMPAAMDYLKRLDQNRGNCLLDYLPDYEEYFRAAGY